MKNNLSINLTTKLMTRQKQKLHPSNPMKRAINSMFDPASAKEHHNSNRLTDSIHFCRLLPFVDVVSDNKVRFFYNTLINATLVQHIFQGF